MNQRIPQDYNEISGQKILIFKKEESTDISNSQLCGNKRPYLRSDCAKINEFTTEQTK